MFVVLAMALLIGTVMTMMPVILGEEWQLTNITDSPFECGIESTNMVRSSFSLPFFLVTIIFVMFDLEVVFLLGFMPFINISSMICMIVFIVVMYVSLLYEWKFSKFMWMV